jgi:hypothetical protein
MKSAASAEIQKEECRASGDRKFVAQETKQLLLKTERQLKLCWC